jgi:dynein heavy chain
MADPTMQRQWQIQGLPTDKYSTENGCFVTKGLRWALNIDPQTQARKWISNTYGDDLVLADTKDPKHVAKITTGVSMGSQVLFVDVEENINPILDNILNKSVTKSAGGKSYVVKVGDSEIDWDLNFKLYITTRMPNPHYTPEVSSKVAIVNFTVKESGLEEQCVGIVVSNVN